MEHKSHALWAGFFTIAMLCAAILGAIWLNRDKTQRTPYEITTTHAVAGLNPQALVRYKGLAVGRVNKIEFDDDVPGQLLIDISIDPETPITTSTFATLGYQGVTGIAFIALDDQGASAPKIANIDGKVPRIPLEQGLLEKIEQSSTKILANAELVTVRMAQLFSPDNQKIILSAFSNTAAATARWKQTAEALEPAVQLLPGMLQQAKQALLSVQTLSGSATELTQHLTGLSIQLQDPKGPLNTALGGVSALSDTLNADILPKFSQLSNEAGKSLRRADQTLQGLDEQPQSLLFGKPTPRPGPGEAGFTSPTP